VLDESYNASPAAMRAALAVLAAISPATGARRVAVLGDMLELGEATERFHRELAEPLAGAAVDRVFLVGRAVAALYDVLPDSNRGGLWSTVDGAIPELLCFLRAGDVLTVKGSHGIGLGYIVERLRAESARTET
jgi:UDP-N-acetylmuramoyl-tripeptide--D-alanyl-D-alanine ligase